MALDHKEPDRVPVDLGGNQTGIVAAAYERLKERLGITAETEIYDPLQQLATPDPEILHTFHIDTRYLFPRSLHPWEPKKMPDGSYIGELEWGHQKIIKKEGCLYYEFYDYPLADATVEDLDNFPYWPVLDASERISGIKETVLDLYESTDYAVVTTLGTGVAEYPSFVRGLERYFLDMIENKRFFTALLDKFLEIETSLYEQFLSVTGEYLDVVQLGGDLGSQHGPLIPPKIYREIIKPREKELIQMVKSKTKAKVYWHTCGDSYIYIPDLIEIGVDILNPVQVSATNMDPKTLKREFGDQISFWGAIDTQRVLPFGTPQQVEDEVKRRIEELAPGGGYVLASVHNIQADVPADNIIAMYKAANKYGSYKHSA
jgi:uroporphyrinogen decarboxylase